MPDTITCTDRPKSFARTDLWILTAVFIASRAIIRFAGVTFDATPLAWFYQFLDPVLLQNRFAESILYLHSQPPGFNMFLGIVLVAARAHAPLLFSLLYLVMGWTMAVILYRLLRSMGVPRMLALGAAIFFMISPPVLLYENWLFYTYPVALLLAASALLLIQYLRDKRAITLLAFLAALTGIVLTRTLFHTFWLVAVILWLIIMQKERTRQILLCSLLPLVTVGIFHVKNMVVFQQTGLSSWLGMNVAKMTLTVPVDRLQRDIDRGALSPIIRLEPFRPPEEYLEYAPFDTVTSIPVLDMQYKSSGYPNFNHVAYITVSRKYLTSALFLIRTYPQYYLLSIIKASYRYLQPCSDRTIFVNDNRSRMNAWIIVYEDYLLGNILRRLWSTTFTNRYGQTRTVHVNFLFLLFPLTVAWGIITALRRGISGGSTVHLTYVFLIATVVYVTIIGNALEMSENMRFRFLILPFIYVIICLFFKQFFKKSP